ncbi:hypothetical protein NECAME_15026 [Necator americanus]|uniref:Uncharacterized protein n=1 Tax=Necator americanus TaxID=51031 RepID=W2SJU5_NECAM|nr:hypothetical protein NECAME_15026 [Necator americanus]ETN69870.1 hypothetical protein NECAME_15026 [Necator americanus]
MCISREEEGIGEFSLLRRTINETAIEQIGFVFAGVAYNPISQEFLTNFLIENWEAIYERLGHHDYHMQLSTVIGACLSVMHSNAEIMLEFSCTLLAFLQLLLVPVSQLGSLAQAGHHVVLAVVNESGRDEERQKKSGLICTPALMLITAIAIIAILVLSCVSTYLITRAQFKHLSEVKNHTQSRLFMLQVV